MSQDLFRKFLNGLPARAGYCVDCLSKMWREPANTISGYLGESGLVGSHAECGNCGERKETFRGSPS
jgi:hypothetical protein